MAGVVNIGKKRAFTKGNGSLSAEAFDFADCSFPVRMQMLGNKLTDAERRVGEYFLRNSEAAYLSITDVVSDSGMGYGTIIRFCRRLGCSGFQEFKVLLAQELSNVGCGCDSADEIAQYAEKIRVEIANTQKLLDRKIILQVCKAIMNAKITLIGAVAGSTSPASGFNYRLSRIGIHSNVISDGYNLAIRAAGLSKNDVFLAISYSGATKDILGAARIAESNNAVVISLTNFVHAPLVELADFSLFGASDRDPMSCEVFSNISFNFVLDVLFSELYKMLPDASGMVENTFRATSGRRV
jgi:DNA-binding MurR/RpiR family transcriptional regulator